MRVPSEIISRWTTRRDELRSLRASVDGGTLCDEVLADLERLSRSDEEGLTLAQAARRSGYTSDHIGRLVRDGKLKNVGRKHAPRVLVSELPQRSTVQIASARNPAYDPDADARSLRAVRR